MHTIKNAVLVAGDGQKIKNESGEGAKVALTLLGLVTQVQIYKQDYSMDDAMYAFRVVKACNDAGTKLKLEDADFDWAIDVVEKFAPKLYGVGAYSLKVALTDEKGAADDEG